MEFSGQMREGAHKPKGLVNPFELTMPERVKQAAEFIRSELVQPPDTVLVLGSGLANLADSIKVHTSFGYAEVPGFKTAGAPGHDGRLLFGELCGRQVVCMQGRLHAYEGHTATEIVFPLHVLAALGAQTLLITNASGGINNGFEVGDIMLINDHINFTGLHPLTIAKDTGLNDFVDMTDAYTPALQERATAAAAELQLDLKQGVYLGLRGPSFETPAEIRAFRVWGADAVGMSTVLEVIAARALGMQICGLSLITNKAAGMLDEPLSGDDVLVASKIAAGKMEQLIAKMLGSPKG